MTRLPIVNGDNGNWGTVLNSFLEVAHNADGTLKNHYINVKDYGALGDGAADDTNAIRQAIAAMPQGYGTVGAKNCLYFPYGTYLVSDTLDIKSHYRQDFIGENVTIQIKDGSDFSGKCLVNFSGSSYVNVKGITFASTLTSNKPTAVIIYGRNAAGAGGDIHFEDCVIGGDCSFASLLWAQADTSSFNRTRISSNGSAPAIFFTSNNDSGLLDYSGSTHTLNRFTDCYIFSYSSTCTKLMVMQGLIQEVKFDTCFFHGQTTDQILFSIEDSAGAGASNQIWNLNFSNCDVESSVGSGGLFMNINNRGSVSSMIINGLNWACATDYLININSISADGGLIGSSISPGVAKSSSSTKTVHLTAGALEQCTIDCYTGDLYVEAGTTCRYNFVRCTGVSPFYGSPGVFSNNFVVERDGATSLGRIGMQTFDAPNGDVRPYANASIVRFNNSSPTSIQTLGNNIPGQIVHCIFLNGNTTIDHTYGYIKLSGSVNWTPPANATLTLLNTGGSNWIEISRMMP
jgi:hypothetical protein